MERASDCFRDLQTNKFSEQSLSTGGMTIILPKDIPSVGVLMMLASTCMINLSLVFDWVDI